MMEYDELSARFPELYDDEPQGDARVLVLLVLAHFVVAGALLWRVLM